MSYFQDPRSLAKFFHEKYESLAPYYGYETRKDSAVAWEDVPEKNKKLMIAVCEQVLLEHALELGELIATNKDGIDFETTVNNLASYIPVDVPEKEKE